MTKEAFEKWLDENLHLLSGNSEKAVRNLYALLTPRWIPVSERLPEEGELVLALVSEQNLTNTGQVRDRRIAIFSPEDGERGWRIGAGKVTHWMPVPLLPEDNSNVR